MKKVEKTKDQLVFTTEINVALANAIRRYVNHIPVMAIDEIEISRNDSPLYDETVAHRLGLVPLQTEKSINEKSTGKLNLDVKKEGIVYTEELKGKPEVIYKNIPITTLDKGQELQLVAKVKPGKGVEHSKFSPGVMFYRNIVDITLDKELADDIKRANSQIEIKEKGNKIVITDNKKKEVSDVCEGIANKKKKKVEFSETKELVITLESFGQMDTQEIFKNSINLLKKDIAEISKKIGKA